MKWNSQFFSIDIFKEAIEMPVDEIDEKNNY